MNEDVSRRGFLKYSIAGAAVATSAGMLGCTSSEQSRATGGSGNVPESWESTSDLVVVGGGTGLIAALLAAHNGRTVAIVEKSSAVGGTTLISGGVLWVPCNRWSEPAGLGVPFTEEQAFDYLKAADVYQGSSDEAKMDYVQNFHRVMEYVEDEIGFSFRPVDWMYTYDKVVNCYTQGISLAFEDSNEGQVITGNYFIDYFLPIIEEQGGTVITNAEATSLIQDETGRVIGVAANREGQEIYVKGEKGVILATGGFDYNEEMRVKYLRGPYFASYAHQQNTGDGIRLGQSIGADLGNMGSTLGGSVFLSEYEPYSFMENIAAFDVYCDYRVAPHGIIVNKRGRRFIDETTPYSIYPDSSFNYDSRDSSFTNIPGYMIFTDKLVEIMGWPNQEESQPEYLIKFDTLSALASFYGIDAENLEDEINRFNGFCETGVDLDFGRGTSPYAKSIGLTELGNIEAPYYVMMVAPAMLGTKGGLKVNLECQVIDVNGSVIEGLYAGGLNAAGIMGSTYGGFGGGIGPGFYQNFRAADHALELGIIN